MSVDAASAACCCGGGSGDVNCVQWLACAPPTLTLNLARSDTSLRAWPTGGRYADTVTFSAGGQLTLGQDGKYRGTILCNARQTNEFEDAAEGYLFEEETQCNGNAWGCPNLDCCATRLLVQSEIVYDEFLVSVEIACESFANGAVIGLLVSASTTVNFTQTSLQLFCPDPSVPNPQVTTGQEDAMSVFNGYSPISAALNLLPQCLPNASLDQYNFDRVATTTAPQISNLTCFRTIPTYPFFQLVATCNQNVGGEDIGTNCGDVVYTERRVSVATLA